MAVASDIREYRIGDDEIPVYPSSIVPSHNLISKSWNDMNGCFKDVCVNSKLKVNWLYECISEHDLKRLWYDMIYNKIITTKSRFFTINTAFPGFPSGFCSGTFYLGTPSGFKSLDTQSNCGAVKYYSLELHWIEVDGIKLNSPTTPAS